MENVGVDCGDAKKAVEMSNNIVKMGTTVLR